MTRDAELLRRYAEERSEEAFAELVQRHIGFWLTPRTPIGEGVRRPRTKSIGTPLTYRLNASFRRPSSIFSKRLSHRFRRGRDFKASCMVRSNGHKGPMPRREICRCRSRREIERCGQTQPPHVGCYDRLPFGRCGASRSSLAGERGNSSWRASACEWRP